MKFMSTFTVILVGVYILITPLTSLAAGLVPCGGVGQGACQTCHVVMLMDNVVDWLIAILSIVAAIIFIYAGARLVVSLGDTSAKEMAKRHISNVIIGYIILLACWILIDTVTKFLLNDQTYGTWNQIQCSEQPKPKEADKQYITLYWNGGDINYDCVALPNGQYNCTEQINSCISSGGTTTSSPITISPTVVCNYPAAASRPPDLSAGGACDPDIVGRYFPDEIGNAQCIIRAESVCGAQNISSIDVMRDGRAFSFGPMQINLTVHELRNCSGYPAVLDCKAAFSGSNDSAVVINEPLYQQCARAAQDTDCNLLNGKIIRDARGSWSDWSTAAGCGLI